MGDTHGYKTIPWMVESKSITNLDIIHVGDFGVGFTNMKQENENLRSLDKKLRSSNVTLHVFRGNHDDPRYFNGYHIYENLKLHEDYTTINIEGKNILGVGGAISIDRETRVGGVSYWSDEVFKLDATKLSDMRDIDVVVTHTAPSFVHPIDNGVYPMVVKQFFPRDSYLRDDLPRERRLLDEMYHILKKNNNIEKWFYGHFHDTVKTKHEETEFILLDIDEMYPYF